MADTQVTKRDGILSEYNPNKITEAIVKAMRMTEVGIDKELAEKITLKVTQQVEKSKNTYSVEQIQDLIEKDLMMSSRKDVAKEYITYRQKRTEERLKQSELFKIGEGIISGDNEEVTKENANLNGESYSGKMNRFGSEYSKMYARNVMLPKRLVKAIDEGYIHVHDLDHYAVGTHNCIFIPFDKLLADGFQVSDKGSVRTPNSIMTAMAQVAIIFQCQQNSQYGGCGASKFDWDLAPYVTKSFVKHFKKGQMYFGETFVTVDIEELNVDNTDLLKVFPKSYTYALEETRLETKQAAESMIHNLNTMASRAGGQVPFTSITFGLCTSTEGRMISEAILNASMNGLGHSETAIFPQLIFQCKQGVNQNLGEPNYDIFIKAIECSSKRLFPNFVNVDADFNLQYYDPTKPDTSIATMGCRTRVISNRFGEVYQSGRGNISFNSINLTKLGIENGVVNGRTEVDVNGFWSKLDEILDITLDGLLHRFDIQGNQPAKASDFMMQNGSWIDGEKLHPNQKIKDLLRMGSVSIGFVGLAECLKALFGKHHGEDQNVWYFGQELIGYIRDYCDKKSDEYDMNVTCFASPAESLAGKFVRMLQKQYGKIEGVTDREYLTNSFHIPVYYEIAAHKKIDLEAPFHKLTNAGHISYVELDGNARNNLEAFKNIVQYALSKNIGYFSINHPVDKCMSCYYDGVINKECPACGENSEEKISKIRRVTGYLTGNVNNFNSAKRAEERDRVRHT
ncbi:anaerobic ribonucleoside-triphosphate reductase [Paenibacillus donghaensis]|uniref:Anaerobic ribonucleoside-triphosphate reductase n=2 Tax=Paenibacillus donghaensis TaxID=414771 RepID=A0A2Z2KXG3_9BACL|nr:anaerobic ribonucleoside triphosphate reductase [Paenibacillus donghaensis]ASA26381.1 anaerobic ribonucleoside-triphosphate reductase [Paenibacillus donghaensis]